MASEDLSIGDVALEVPESLIISEDLVYGSDVVCSVHFAVISYLGQVMPLILFLKELKIKLKSSKTLAS